MDWITIPLLLLILVHNELRFRTLSAKVKEGLRSVTLSISTRQNSIKFQNTDQPPVPIDFDPKTVRRDTDDIPHTGRMGKLQPWTSGEDDE